jgi:hypothetical protein
MKTSQGNYLNMVKAVGDIFDTNKPVWENIPQIVTGSGNLKIFVADINKASTGQKENASSGHTAAKELARTTLEDRLFSIGKKLRAYAIVEEDSVAEDHSAFSRALLDQLSFNNLLNLGRAVQEIVKPRLESVKEYGIVEEDLSNLQADIDKLSVLNAHRDAVVDLRMVYTEFISEKFSAIRRELRKLDALVEAFIDDEAFHSLYFNARRIHNTKR